MGSQKWDALQNALEKVCRASSALPPSLSFRTMSYGIGRCTSITIRSASGGEFAGRSKKDVPAGAGASGSRGKLNPHPSAIAVEVYCPSGIQVTNEPQLHRFAANSLSARSNEHGHPTHFKCAHFDVESVVFDAAANGGDAAALDGGGNSRSWRAKKWITALQSTWVVYCGADGSKNSSDRNEDGVAQAIRHFLVSACRDQSQLQAEQTTIQITLPILGTGGGSSSSSGSGGLAHAVALRILLSQTAKVVAHLEANVLEPKRQRLEVTIAVDQDSASGLQLMKNIASGSMSPGEALSSAWSGHTLLRVVLKDVRGKVHSPCQVLVPTSWGFKELYEQIRPADDSMSIGDLEVWVLRLDGPSSQRAKARATRVFWRTRLDAGGSSGGSGGSGSAGAEQPAEQPVVWGGILEGDTIQLEVRQAAAVDVGVGVSTALPAGDDQAATIDAQALQIAALQAQVALLQQTQMP